MIINPGSGPIQSGDGWTNTRERADQYAEKWLSEMRDEGFVDISFQFLREEDGRFVYGFTHTVTGVTVELEHHGIDNMDAYKKEHIFTPRIYWDGGSSSTPEIDDFLTPEFVAEWKVRRVAFSAAPTEEKK